MLSRKPAAMKKQEVRTSSQETTMLSEVSQFRKAYGMFPHWQNMCLFKCVRVCMLVCGDVHVGVCGCASGS